MQRRASTQHTQTLHSLESGPSLRALVYYFPALLGCRPISAVQHLKPSERNSTRFALCETSTSSPHSPCIHARVGPSSISRVVPGGSIHIQRGQPHAYSFVRSPEQPNRAHCQTSTRTLSRARARRGEVKQPTGKKKNCRFWAWLRPLFSLHDRISHVRGSRTLASCPDTANAPPARYSRHPRVKHCAPRQSPRVRRQQRTHALITTKKRTIRRSRECRICCRLGSALALFCHHDRTSQVRGSRTFACPDTATAPSERHARVEHRTKTSLPEDVTRARSTSIRTSTLSPTSTGRSNLGCAGG